MLDLLVFTQYPKAYAPTRLLREAKKLGYRIQIIGYGGIKNINKLPRAKAVILREPNIDYRLYNLRNKVLEHYKKEGSFVLNSKSYTKWKVLDKALQHQEFKKGKIPFIKTLKIKFSKNIKIKYPIIAKSILGSHGDHVYKIENEKDLKKVISKYGVKNLLFQEFQKTGFDLRVIVIDFKVVGIMKRIPKSGEFKSNFSQGGTINKFNKDKESIKSVKQIAIKTAKHFKLDYVGVDIMKDDNGFWKVLEVNRACQFKGFEKATRVNVVQKLLQYIVRRNK